MKNGSPQSTFQKLPGKTEMFDLAALAVPDDMLPSVRVDGPAQRKRREHFIRVPFNWHERLLKARYVATPLLAQHILYRHWKRKGEPITLSNGAMPGVSRFRKYRALAELEALGLIAVERRPDKSPVVQVLGVRP
jgi:hypothetical protein